MKPRSYSCVCCSWLLSIAPGLPQEKSETASQPRTHRYPISESCCLLKSSAPNTRSCRNDGIGTRLEFDAWSDSNRIEGLSRYRRGAVSRAPKKSSTVFLANGLLPVARKECWFDSRQIYDHRFTLFMPPVSPTHVLSVVRSFARKVPARKRRGGWIQRMGACV